MDRNFYTDDFERLLREKSDEFRLYPSKRIWHSIYNNIHPGRKWPSVAMSITLITAILLMGYLNTNNSNLDTVSGNNTLQQKIIAQKKPLPFVSQTPTEYAGNKNQATGTLPYNNNSAASINNVNNKINNKVVPQSSTVAILTVRQSSISDIMDPNNGRANINNPAIKETINPFNTGINSLMGLTNELIETADDNETVSGDDQSGVLTLIQKTAISNLIENTDINDLAFQDINKKITVHIQGGNTAVEKNILSVNKKYFISTEDKDWIENYALYNRPAAKKWANKLALQMYATPSVVYRILYNDPNFGNTPNTTPFAISPANLNINNAVYQSPSVGFEIGTGIQYSIFKGVKLKGGLQLNYTRYNSHAFQNTHPVSTKLTMNDYKTNTSYEEYRTTPYSNKNGLEAAKLHNETFQISIPMGADLKLIGNENLQWNFGVTIQPTYIAAGKSYLISSDRRNYVKETSMLNKWNLNAGFETFISFKANGLTWQIGPQFRTQLFSTNSKKFAVEERLINYGLKFGVSKTIK